MRAALSRAPNIRDSRISREVIAPRRPRRAAGSRPFRSSRAGLARRSHDAESGSHHAADGETRTQTGDARISVSAASRSESWLAVTARERATGAAPALGVATRAGSIGPRRELPSCDHTYAAGLRQLSATASAQSRSAEPEPAAAGWCSGRLADAQRLMRSVSWAHMAISTRFRAPSLAIRLAR
jgi:hypothetical protein